MSDWLKEDPKPTQMKYSELITRHSSHVTDF